VTPSGPEDTSDPGTNSDEGENENDYEEMEIDETSDGEDDRRAHELLQVAPAQAATMGGSSPISLPYDNYNFVVRFIIWKHMAITDSCIAQELSPDQPVLQQHHARNRAPKAPAPAPALAPAPQLPSTPVSLPILPQPSSNGRSTLDVYPPLWREVINNAKKTFRVYLAGKNRFPNPAEAVKEAQECLEDALAVHREEGRMVETSKHNHHR